MNRRKYLTCTAAVGLTGIAGCLNEVPEALTDPGSGREFGESVEHRGLEVAPTHSMTADEVTFDVEQGATIDETAPSGAEFLLTRIEAANRGDHERVLPSRSSGLGGGSGRNIWIYYGGEETSTVIHEDTSKWYEVGGSRLTPYTQSRLQDATGPVYPGTAIEGWIVAEITEDFNVEETKIEIELGDGSESEVFEWTYSSDTMVSPEEVPESEGTTTEI